MNMDQIKYLLFQKKYPFLIVNWTAFEWALILGGVYYFTSVNPAALAQMLVLIIAVVFHEAAHAYVATLFGDSTAKRLGRVTLNPLPHIDPLGSVILPALLLISGSGFIIGWAKPVPVNSENFDDPFQGMMWVALAGPLTNVSIAVLSSIFLKFLMLIGIETPVHQWFLYFFQASIVINLVLAIFNMVPIPPLDGSRVLMRFLPSELQYKLAKLEPYGFFIIMLLVFMGAFSLVLGVFLPPLLRVLL